MKCEIAAALLERRGFEHQHAGAASRAPIAAHKAALPAPTTSTSGRSVDKSTVCMACCAGLMRRL